MTKQNQAKTALIESHAHDQGGGSSWCSACHESIDLRTIASLNYICPKCKRELSFGEMTVSLGGSDYP